MTGAPGRPDAPRGAGAVISLRAAVAAAMVALAAVSLWRAELYTVQRPGQRPAPLALEPASVRRSAEVAIVLPCVPIGTRRVASDAGVTLVHYWAPWERGASSQAAGLDSLRRLPEVHGLEAFVVCFDPFPSVARFVGRRRLRIPVLLDGRGTLRDQLPCPSIPYTYVLDGAGRIAVRQAGQVDWLSPGTRRALEALLAERRASPRLRTAAPS